MADMTTYQMLDDTNLTTMEAHITSDIHALAGYVNGSPATWASLVAKFSRSGKYLLSIDVLNDPKAGAQCLDIETGDATIDDAPGWFKATQTAGKEARDLRYYPKLYTSAANLSPLIAKMTGAGYARSEYLLWSAHYTGEAHICGPHTCGYPQADATQWAIKDGGASVDQSLCFGYFFAGPGDSLPSFETLVDAAPAAAPKPAASPAPAKPASAPAAPKPASPPNPAAVVDVPQPSPEPEAAPVGATSLVTVYVQATLDADIAAQLNLPVGTLLFIPHTVEGA